jgi:bacterioferritin-associated ferredoxin
MQPDERTLARLKPGCICMGIKLSRILKAIDQGASTFEEVAQLTGIGRGDCHGRRCRQKVDALLAERSNHDFSPDQDLCPKP